MDEKSHSAACDRNAEVIGDQLEQLLEPGDLVWEVGSGTGQHSVTFGARFPDVVWQPSDRVENHPSIRAWGAEAGLNNVREVLAFDLFDATPPVEQADAVFCANTIHIAPWEATPRLFAHAARVLSAGGCVITYGPYRYADRELEPSNERFEQWLKSTDPRRGIRDFEDVVAAAEAVGLRLDQDIEMPANNHLLVFRRT